MYHKFWPPHFSSFLCILFIAWLLKTKDDVSLDDQDHQRTRPPNITAQCNHNFQCRSTRIPYHNSGMFFSCISRWLICWNRFRSVAMEKHFTNSLLYLNNERSPFDILIPISAIQSVQVEASFETDAVRFKLGHHSYFVRADMIYRNRVPLLSIKVFVGRAFDICDADIHIGFG